MQTETHFHLETRHPSLKSLVPLVVYYVRVLIYLGNNFEETKKGQVCQVLIFLREFVVSVFIWDFGLTEFSEELILIFEFPNQKESITDVFVG